MSYENEISFKLAHGELTELIFDEFCYGDPFTVDDSVDLSDIETANTLNDRPIFLEGVIRRFSDMGLHFTLSDTEALIDEIKKRYKARMGKKCPRTVVEWFRGTPPGVTNRRNNYELCYALEMNLQETAEFFQKCFLTIPFNYKDASDAVFFYCLLKNRDYAIISSMLEAVEAVNESTAGETETQIHARNILSISDDAVFLEYLKKHCYSDSQQYKTAKRKISALIAEHQVGSLADLHANLVGFKYQSIKKEKWVNTHKLPKRFTESLPMDGSFDKIIKGETVSYEVLRKALIIMLLFDSFGETPATEDPDDIDARMHDFFEETNVELAQCGFAQLYPRHPFDWLIMFCANSSDPMESFRLICENWYKAPETVLV